MKRKLIQHGESTLMISLPAAWLKTKGMRKGDALEMTEQDGSIVLRPQGTAPFISTIDTRNLGVLTRRVIGLHYKLGYDHVEAHVSPDQLPATHDEIAKLLPGFEIVGQQDDKLIIKDISGTTTNAFDSIVRKILLVTTNFAENIRDHLAAGDVKKLAETRLLEDTINKLTNYSLRLINKWGYAPKPSRSNYVYVTLWNWEKVGDELKFICDYFTQRKKAKLGNTAIALLSDVTAYVRAVSELLAKYDAETAGMLSTKRKQLVAKLLAFDGTKDELVLMHHMLTIVNDCFDCVGTWMGTVY